MSTTVDSEINNIELRNRYLLIRRYKMPEQKSEESNIVLPTHYNKLGDDGKPQSVETPPFQNRGEVVVVGTEADDKYKVGEIVHFQPARYLLAYIDKLDTELMFGSGMHATTPYILLDAEAVDWVEKK